MNEFSQNIANIKQIMETCKNDLDALQGKSIECDNNLNSISAIQSNNLFNDNSKSKGWENSFNTHKNAYTNRMQQIGTIKENLQQAKNLDEESINLLRARMQNQINSVLALGDMEKVASKSIKDISLKDCQYNDICEETKALVSKLREETKEMDKTINEIENKIQQINQTIADKNNKLNSSFDIKNQKANIKLEIKDLTKNLKTKNDELKALIKEKKKKIKEINKNTLKINKLTEIKEKVHKHELQKHELQINAIESQANEKANMVLDKVTTLRSTIKGQISTSVSNRSQSTSNLLKIARKLNMYYEEIIQYKGDENKVRESMDINQKIEGMDAQSKQLTNSVSIEGELDMGAFLALDKEINDTIARIKKLYR